MNSLEKLIVLILRTWLDVTIAIVLILMIIML